MSDRGNQGRGSKWPPPQDRAILQRLAGAFAGGLIGGAIAAIALIASDLGGIQALTVGPSGDLTGAILLVWGMAVLFGFVGLGISIMSLGDWNDQLRDD